MVKNLFFLFFSVVFLCSAGEHNLCGKVWVIRHGQRAQIKAPDFDPPLTPTGRKQAVLAGEFLKKSKFNGKIYASPYRRTLETAAIIAKILNCDVYTAPFLQEFVRFPGRHKIKVRPLAELKKEFPVLAEQPDLPSHWPISSKETLDTVRDRYRAGLEKLALRSNEEVLLVTHGAVLKGAHMYATGRSGSGKWEKMNWNCCISAYEFTPGTAPVIKLFFEINFMPAEMISSNERYLVKRSDTQK